MRIACLSFLEPHTKEPRYEDYSLVDVGKGGRWVIRDHRTDRRSHRCNPRILGVPRMPVHCFGVCDPRNRTRPHDHWTRRLGGNRVGSLFHPGWNLPMKNWKPTRPRRRRRPQCRSPPRRLAHDRTSRQ